MNQTQSNRNSTFNDNTYNSFRRTLQTRPPPPSQTRSIRSDTYNMSEEEIIAQFETFLQARDELYEEEKSNDEENHHDDVNAVRLRINEMTADQIDKCLRTYLQMGNAYNT